jgi:uncharacterized protein (UPF0264 family)
MLDTYIKDKQGIFDFLNVKQLIEFKEKSHKLDIEIALAGNLSKSDLPNIRKINPDIIGVRSMVCDGFDRNNGVIRLDLIEDLKLSLYT